MSDRIFAAVWLVLCIVGMVIAWQIQSEYSYEPVGRVLSRCCCSV